MLIRILRSYWLEVIQYYTLDIQIHAFAGYRSKRGILKKIILFILVFLSVSLTLCYGGSDTIYYTAEDGKIYLLSETDDQTPKLTETELKNLEKNLLSIWDSAFKAIQKKDIQKALTFFLSVDGEKYRRMLGTVTDEQISESLSESYKLKSATKTFAEFRSEKGKVLLFAIDQDGKWKIFF